MICIDKAILTILTLVISTGGILEFAKYEPRELNFSYFGENPFAVKKQAIDQTMKYLFIKITVLGVLIQILPIIFPQIPDRQYSSQFYIVFLVACFCFFILIMVNLKKFGSYFSKKKWIPSIISSQKQSFELAEHILEHDGLTHEQLNRNFTNLEECIKANYLSAEEHIKRIERLLEIPSSSETLIERKNNLKKFFS